MKDFSFSTVNTSFAGYVPDLYSFSSRSCPASLEAGITRAVLDEARSIYLNDPVVTTPGAGSQDQVDCAVPTASNNTKGK